MTQTLTACRTAGCTAPETADHATLHRIGDADLLRAFAALTHRIQSAEAKLPDLHRGISSARGQVSHAWAKQEVRDLRAQRDIVQAEALRRMGGQS